MADIPKRDFLIKLAGGLIAIPTAIAAAREFQQQPGPIAPVPSAGQQQPQQPDTAPDPPVIADPKEMLKEHQHKIQDDVEKLYSLAGELKDEVEKTQTEHVLSLPMIQKAEQIEKLAKQIKTFARGD